ncbi:MAG: hydroxymethylbilane synthase [Sedimentisphaerales bacterium]|nr:hydroxymethylbilane synthase [Sedimentisphaerales bacterium]
MAKLKVVTRRGALALAQTQMVIAAVKAQHPDVDIEVEEVTSEGDRDRRTVLWNLKDTGFFTSRLEEILVAGEADFAVHSFKDLPTRQREGLTVGAVYDRRFPQDCLLARRPVASLDELGVGAKIGTSSLRRVAQLRHLRKNLVPVPVRGNVQTRIRKLQEGDLDAIVLARAGLERLGLTGLISFAFDPYQFVPAPAQGALAIQTRVADTRTNEMLSSIDDPEARAITEAERQVLVGLRCGCHAPVGAYAECAGNTLTLEAFIADPSGTELLRARATGPVSSACEIGEEAAQKLLKAGGRRILDTVEKDRDRGDIDG